MAATPILNPETETVALAVWPCAQTSAQYQRAGRYLPASTLHPGKMLPELARRIVQEYSAPGGLVVDPMCGIGTTLVEGALLGRRCVGVELEPRWAGLAGANLDHLLTAGNRGRAEVRVGDARQLRAPSHKMAPVSTRRPCGIGGYQRSPSYARRRMIGDLGRRRA